MHQYALGRHAMQHFSGAATPAVMRRSRSGIHLLGGEAMVIGGRCPSGDHPAVSVTFTDGSPLGVTARTWWYRVRGRRWWHNRIFTPRQSIDRTGDGFLVRWQGRGEVHARSLADLACRGPRAAILASGPSVAEIHRPERLFRAPVACVNGSVALPSQLGCRCDYLLVSDPRFIRDQPNLFRIGTALTDAVVLDPPTIFAALEFAPDALARANVYLTEDVLRPFKRPRPTREALAADARLVVHPSSRIVFSLDPTRGIGSGGTVVYNAVQLLFGIGYTEVVMFGVDLLAGRRFYPERTPAPTELDSVFTQSIQPAFELVGDYLRRTGRTLVNASPASRLSAAVIQKADANETLARLCRYDA